MNKSTLAFLLLAALVLGSLIGINQVERTETTAPTANANVASAELAAPDSVDDAPRFRYLAPGDLPIEFDDFDRATPSATGENYIGRTNAWKTQTLEVELPIDGKVEYKAMMQQGDAIVFDWSTDNGTVYYDFHGHDDAFGKDFFVRYQDSESAQHSGMIVAAFAGEHGWYWLNMNDGPIRITLRVAGFFDNIIRLEVEDYQ